ncbi:MAG TPA: Flp pilus assembly protein CpaB [Micromonosporaceae bacterium]|jgi:pilus assembly protein CpaB
MTRRILAILLATVLAAIGTLAVLFYVKRADDRAVAETTAVEVLVAKQRVPAGTTGESIRKRKLVELMRLPAGSVPKDEALTDIPPELDKLVITSDLQPRQLLLRGMFSQSTRSSGGLAIPSGKVAVSFLVTAAGQVAGYVRPGSQVAVYAEYHLSDDGKRQIIGEGKGDHDSTGILLPRVDVIAVGPYGEGATTTTPLNTQQQSSTGNQPSREGVLVTVAVSPDDAATLIHAAQADAIHLALVTEDSGPLRAGIDTSAESTSG